MRNSDERTAPLQAAFPKTVPKRFPEMVSARRSYGNDRRARSGDVKHMIVVTRQVRRPALPQPMRDTCGKPCRFVRLYGNQDLEVFRHLPQRGGALQSASIGVCPDRHFLFRLFDPGYQTNYRTERTILNVQLYGEVAFAQLMARRCVYRMCSSVRFMIRPSSTRDRR
jgi:hypothetical protein